MTEYDVKREHYGDKYYQTGDKRTANPADVKHLVDKGVLVEPVEEPKPKTTKTTAKRAKPE
ncbi:hypothetical protein BEN71_10290 [Acinetobacter wuhouensis]|uniref:hypothetical protein n=1 Tax=Acinetobacter wuhouensis TaxID=1879050 RepID=UPI00083A2E2D|nr:hypothetical protein [Acinetobacter wuhouensis]AXQ21825.1 hypothetical protein BEN71_07000 [Acinetobacter wuhouensis]AXQ22439.1 hypothetical protein BEN71_10290 [Acinetobacter wuhouensis]